MDRCYFKCFISARIVKNMFAMIYMFFFYINLLIGLKFITEYSISFTPLSTLTEAVSLLLCLNSETFPVVH